MEKINCRKCKYFYVTWDKNFPYGCKKLNFKSRVHPCINVFQSSGEECLYFDCKEK